MVKIITWNVLAPELMLYFWRSSYGLDLLDRPSDYDAIMALRFNNIVKYLKGAAADIICLQEVTNVAYSYLGGKTPQQYIADTLGYVVVSQSFKQSAFNANYPPREQTRKLSMDSGVATLMRTGTGVQVSHNGTEATAETFGASKIFTSGVGSPFTLDRFTLTPTSDGNGNGDGESRMVFYLCNVHIRMEYPRILRPLNEVYKRIGQVLSTYKLKKTVVVGDFNAGGLIAAKDLFKSDFYLHMFDEQGHQLIDDHVFIGNLLRSKMDLTVSYDKSLNLLQMNANEPTSQPKLWGVPGTSYNQIGSNNTLIRESKVTTDHYPIMIAIRSDKEKRGNQWRSAQAP